MNEKLKIVSLSDHKPITELEEFLHDTKTKVLARENHEALGVLAVSWSEDGMQIHSHNLSSVDIIALAEAIKYAHMKRLLG